MTHAKRSGEKRVNLALQGGGAHGAFTWGVLDHLLEDGRLEIDAVSGASAGAMNAVVMAEGYLDHGRDGARANLAAFWLSVSEDGALSPAQRTLFGQMFKAFNYDGSPLQIWGEFMTHYASPYEFNPLNLNPLRDHLEKVVDFEKVRACEHFKIFVAATNVHTGKIAVFQREELTASHIMASACLPTLFQAVEIDGTPFWDGGYMGNPALFPLFYEKGSPDTIIVQVNPLARNTTPKTAREIANRLNEITFNATLLRELRATDFVIRLIDEGKLPRDRYMRPNLHRIDGGAPLSGFSAATKLDTSWTFLTQLRDLGRAAAKAWMHEHYAMVGQNGTLDLRAAYE